MSIYTNQQREIANKISENIKLQARAIESVKIVIQS